MPFKQTILPQYRDADPDGLIGLKGCMHYFQDIHTYLHAQYTQGKRSDGPIRLLRSVALTGVFPFAAK